MTRILRAASARKYKYKEGIKCEPKEILGTGANIQSKRRKCCRCEYWATTVETKEQISIRGTTNSALLTTLPRIKLLYNACIQN